MKKSVEKSIIKGLENVPKTQQDGLLLRYDILLEKGKIEHPLPEKIKGNKGRTKKSKCRNLVERSENHKQSVVGFLEYFRIVFSNNLAEQSIKMMKVQEKISCYFRSETCAKSLAIKGKALIPFAQI